MQGPWYSGEWSWETTQEAVGSPGQMALDWSTGATVKHVGGTSGFRMFEPADSVADDVAELGRASEASRRLVQVGTRELQVPWESGRDAQQTGVKLGAQEGSVGRGRERLSRERVTWYLNPRERVGSPSESM